MSDTDLLAKATPTKSGKTVSHGLKKIVSSPLQVRINFKKLLLRMITGIFMMLMLTLFVMMGPLFLIAGIAFIQLVVFKEVISIAYSKSKEKKLPWFRTTIW